MDMGPATASPGSSKASTPRHGRRVLSPLEPPSGRSTHEGDKSPQGSQATAGLPDETAKQRRKDLTLKMLIKKLGMPKERIEEALAATNDCTRAAKEMLTEAWKCGRCGEAKTPDRYYEHDHRWLCASPASLVVPTGVAWPRASVREASVDFFWGRVASLR